MANRLESSAAPASPINMDDWGEGEFISALAKLERLQNLVYDI